MTDDANNVHLFPVSPQMKRQPPELCITHADMERELTHVIQIWAECDEIVAALNPLIEGSDVILSSIQRVRLERIFSFLTMVDAQQHTRRAEIAISARIREARATVTAQDELRQKDGLAEVVSLSVARVAADRSLSDYDKILAVHQTELAHAKTDEERQAIAKLIATLQDLAAPSKLPPTTDEAGRANLVRELEILIDRSKPDPAT